MRTIYAVTYLLSGLALAAGSSLAASLRWEPVVAPDDQLFPSAIIATSTIRVPEPDKTQPKQQDSRFDYEMIGDSYRGWLAIRLVSPRENCPLRITVRCTALMEESTYEITLPMAGKKYEVYPDIAWNFDALLAIRQVKPATITFELSIDDISQGRISRRATVRSINDCLTGAIHQGQPLDFSYLFAAYVNEDHPFVDQILKSAKDSGVIREFTGYQSKDPQQVYRQVYAIWHVMQRMGLTYSSITNTAAISDKVRSQHVRFLDQALNATQANCVDGSVLFASVLRKIGIDPGLILVPGHMFVAFYLDAEHRSPVALETTMLGEINLQQFREDGTFSAELDRLFGADTKGTASWKTFVRALDVGRQRFYDAALKARHKTPGYQDLDVAAQRKLGIIPIAYK